MRCRPMPVKTTIEPDAPSVRINHEGRGLLLRDRVIA